MMGRNVNAVAVILAIRKQFSYVVVVFSFSAWRALLKHWGYFFRY